MAHAKKKQSSNSLGLEAQSLAQSLYIRSIEDKTVSVGLGFAGTGKTYIAATMAAQFKIDHKKGRIILCRPNVSDSRGIGYLPGDEKEKMAPWIRPYTDVFNIHLNGTTEKYLEDGTILAVPFEHMQGLSFNDCYVLLDEAQHTTRKEMEMFLKRIGKNCKVIISGDIQQARLGETSGLALLVELCNNKVQLQEYIGITEFNDPNDIVRSDFCRVITQAFDEE